jgi:hypothetical protein
MKRTMTFNFLQENIEKFFEQEQEITSLIEEFKNLMNNYSSLFSNKSAYEYILKKIHLIETDKITEMFPLAKIKEDHLAISLSSKNCPEIFSFLTANSRGLGLTILTQNSYIREYCLLFNLKGETSLISYFENGESLIYNTINEGDALFVDLPLVLNGILEDTEFPARKKLLEKTVKDNPRSTLTNIYHYTKTHNKEISGLKEKLLELGEFIEKVDVHIYRHSWQEGPVNKIKNGFLFTSGQRGIPYQILKEEEAKPYIGLDFKSGRIYFYKFIKCAEYFPIKIISKNNIFEPVFLSHAAFKLKTAEEKSLRDATIVFDKKDFLTLPEKVEEIISEEKKSRDLSEWDRLQSNLVMSLEISKMPRDWFEALSEKDLEKYKKNIATALNKNLNDVLSSVKDTIGFILSENALGKQEKDNKKMKKFCEVLNKKYEEIANVLAKIYEKEILLKVL